MQVLSWRATYNLTYNIHFKTLSKQFKLFEILLHVLFAVRFGGDARGRVLRLLQQQLVVDSGVRELLRQLPKTGLVRSLKQSVCGLRVCLLSIKQLQVLNIIEYSLCFFFRQIWGPIFCPTHYSCRVYSDSHRTCCSV